MIFFQSSFQEGTSFKQGDIFYLSWSHPEQLYCVKKDVLGNEADADGYAVIDVEYVSFPAGSSKQLLENIRSSQSKSLLQCAYGVVRDVHADEKGFHIGDEVIIIYNSKWLRSRILVPTSQVIRKPPELCSKLAAASTGTYLTATPRGPHNTKRAYIVEIPPFPCRCYSAVSNSTKLSCKNCQFY